MGKLTISMAIFNSYVTILVYQRATNGIQGLYLQFNG